MKNEIILTGNFQPYQNNNGRIYRQTAFLSALKDYQKRILKSVEDLAWEKKREEREKKLKRILGIDVQK